MPTPRPLPMATPPPRVRRDAAANSDRILAAARDVIRCEGVESLTMDLLAARAGVGKGTIFRAFGNRSGLFAALTDESERSFQQEFLSGPPPLGPGAPPLERLLAYGEGRLRLYAIHGPLMAMSRDADRFVVPARQLSAAHVRMLLQQCGVHDHLDVIVEALLAPLDAETTYHLTATRDLTAQDLLAGWQQLVRSVVAAA
ncbi:MAG TPA: helix-turn-helix domain-containing protein [Flexivirga sp.]|uniref:TetR/AcrR family transcriptional regulator n=1 Tax=Flexivirga sp. TaxID=1962927 RepID=UPI002C905D23|nr:helix-turn-helix domain-containing protein [Flexivirga sp.]HWC21564.1 helix-turn-helix domain-containing protein [Flexivirga sp.]